MGTKAGDPTLPFPAHRWPPGHRRWRILVECSDHAVAWAAQQVLEGSGFEVMVCWGPSCLPHATCPVLTGKRCPLVDGADIIVHSSSVDDTGAVLAALREGSPEKPLCIHVQPTTVSSVTEACEVIGPPLTPVNLVEAANDALSRIVRRSVTRTDTELVRERQTERKRAKGRVDGRQRVGTRR